MVDSTTNQTNPQLNNNSNANSFSDGKTFYDNWIDHHKGVLIFAGIILFIGIIMYLQVCGVISSGSDPSGIAGSSAASSNNDGDSDQINPYVASIFEFLALILILIGGGLFLYYWELNSISKKLISKGDYYGALEINAKKGKEGNVELLKYQYILDTAKVASAGVDVKHFLEEKQLIAADVTSDDETVSTESDSGSDSDSDSSD